MPIDWASDGPESSHRHILAQCVNRVPKLGCVTVHPPNNLIMCVLSPEQHNVTPRTRVLCRSITNPSSKSRQPKTCTSYREQLHPLISTLSVIACNISIRKSRFSRNVVSHRSIALIIFDHLVFRLVFFERLRFFRRCFPERRPAPNTTRMLLQSMEAVQINAHKHHLHHIKHRQAIQQQIFSCPLANPEKPAQVNCPLLILIRC